MNSKAGKKRIKKSSPFLLCCLQHIGIEAERNRGIEIVKGLFLTNTTKYFSQVLDDTFMRSVGTLKFDQIANSSSYCYSERQYSNNFNAEQEIVKFAVKISTLKTLLWLIKDHSVNYDSAFVRYPKNYLPVIKEIGIKTQCTKSNGETSPTIYSEHDIVQLLNISKTIKQTHKHSNIDQNVIKEKTRLHVFLYHLDHARSSRDIAFKILSYCSALETLFATSTSDTTQQIAKRIALFTSNNHEKRLKIYHKMKEAFRVRYLITHGERIKPRLQERLIKISNRCDSTARNIFIKISSHGQFSKIFKSETAVIDDYFTELMFKR